MSRFSGKQYRGATRVLNEIKREEAEARQKAYDKIRPRTREEMDAALTEPLDEVLSSEEVGQMVEEMKKNDNPGPALPGLAKRARKITRK